MFHPEPMPQAAVGSPVEEADTSCLGCFSRRVGLISICWILVVTSLFNFFTTISYMVLARGGVLAIFILFFLANLVDGGVAGLLLLGIRDRVVRTRLNTWIIWNAIYAVVELLLVIILLCVIPIVAGIGVLTGMQLAIAFGFRVFCIWTGWRYRNEIMAAPPRAVQHRPDMGPF